MTQVKKSPRKRAVRLYESQHQQVKLLAQLGAQPGHISQIFNVSDSTAREAMKGKISISPGRRDLTGGVLYDQPDAQVRKVLRFGELLSVVNPDKAPFLLHLRAAADKTQKRLDDLIDDVEVPDDVLTPEEAAELEPEPAPEPAVAATISASPGVHIEYRPPTTSANIASAVWSSKTAPSPGERGHDAPIFMQLVKERIEAMAKDAVQKAIVEAFAEWSD